MKNENILLVIIIILILLFLLGGCAFVIMDYGSCADGLKYGYSIFGKFLFNVIFGSLILAALILFIVWIWRQVKKEYE